MNAFITIWGWLAWNFFWFMVEKDKFDDADKKFPFKSYAEKNWENWVWSAILIPILLFYARIGMGFDVFGQPDFNHLKWNDAYYPCVGLFSDVVGMLLKLLRKRLSKMFKDE